MNLKYLTYAAVLCFLLMLSSANAVNNAQGDSGLYNTTEAVGHVHEHAVVYGTVTSVKQFRETGDIAISLRTAKDAIPLIAIVHSTNLEFFPDLAPLVNKYVGLRGKILNGSNGHLKMRLTRYNQIIIPVKK